jgi:hypothetical protein
MTPTAFRVTSQELKNLSPAQSVGALQDVLIAEAKLLGIPLTGVNVPATITTRDGGVDAEVNCPIATIGHNGVLRSGFTCYQVKTGDFSISSLTHIKAILLRPSSRRRRNFTPADLNDRVKDCLDRNGTLIVALFGSEAVDRKANASEDAFRDFLSGIDERYRSASIEIWRLNQLVTFVSNVTGLALRIKGPGEMVLFAHDHAWMGNSSAFEGNEFLASEKHNATVELIRSTIREAGPFRHIRIVGEAGCGKTRLVYEALNEKDIAAIEQFGRSGTIFGEYQPQSLEFLESVVERFPSDIWQTISECLEPPLNERAWDLLRWMRGADRSRGGARNSLLLSRDSRKTQFSTG